MKPVTQLILVLEAGVAVALLEAALSGESTLQSNGLHVAKIAYERIGFTILGVCVLSCLLASVLLVRAEHSRSRADGWGFLAAVLLALLAASAFANAAGRITFYGSSTEWFSWPATLWLFGLVGRFVLRACDVSRGAAMPAESDIAPECGGMSS